MVGILVGGFFSLDSATSNIVIINAAQIPVINIQYVIMWNALTTLTDHMMNIDGQLLLSLKHPNPRFKSP